MPTESFDKHFILDSEKAIESFVVILNKKPATLNISPEIRRMTSPESEVRGLELILRFLADCILKANICKYDEEQNIFTCFNSEIPQIFGEGHTEQEAKESMVDEAIEFLEDYKSDPKIHSYFNEVQHAALKKLLLITNDRSSLKNLLGIT